MIDDYTIIANNSYWPNVSRGENNHYYAAVIVEGTYPNPWVKIYKNTGIPSSSSWEFVIGIYNNDEVMDYMDIEVVSSNNTAHVIYNLGYDIYETFWFTLSDPVNNGFSVIPNSDGHAGAITSDEVEFNGGLVYLYVTWNEGDNINFSRSTNQGVTWSDTINVVGDASNMYFGNSITYCPGNNKIFIAYENTSDDIVVAKQSGEFGSGSFSSTTVMSSTSAEYFKGGIASYNNTILVLGQGVIGSGSDYDLMFVYSTNSGSSWSNIWYWEENYDQWYPSVTANDDGYFSILYYNVSGPKTKAKRNYYSNLTGSWSAGVVDDDHGWLGPSSACIEDGSEPNYGGAYASGYSSSSTTYFGWVGVGQPDLVAEDAWIAWMINGQFVEVSDYNYIEYTSEHDSLYFMLDYSNNSNVGAYNWDLGYGLDGDIESSPGWDADPNTSYTIYWGPWLALNDGYHYVEWWLDYYDSIEESNENNNDATTSGYVGIEEQLQFNIVTDYSLSQNFPNPFNPTTILTFALPKASNVNLTVFDLQGRTVATLVNGWRFPGTYEITWNAADLPAGVYIARLEAGFFSASQKMVLVK